MVLGLDILTNNFSRHASLKGNPNRLRHRKLIPEMQSSTRHDCVCEFPTAINLSRHGDREMNPCCACTRQPLSNLHLPDYKTKKWEKRLFVFEAWSSLSARLGFTECRVAVHGTSSLSCCFLEARFQPIGVYARGRNPRAWGRHNQCSGLCKHPWILD